jgi:hypothetical protein
VLQKAKILIKQATESLHGQPGFSQIQVAVDVDPM